MERLCALVPRPRRHLVTYHGVFAPAAGIRPWAVPKVELPEAAVEAGAWGIAAELVDAAVGAVVGGAAPKPAAVLQQTQLAERVRRSLSARAPGVRRKRRTGPRRRYTWASLLRRVFLIEVLVCPRCGGTRRLLAAIQDPESIRKVLGSLWLLADVPVVPAYAFTAAASGASVRGVARLWGLPTRACRRGWREAVSALGGKMGGMPCQREVRQGR